MDKGGGCGGWENREQEAVSNMKPGRIRCEGEKQENEQA